MKNVDSVENLKTNELVDPNENLKSWYIDQNDSEGVSSSTGAGGKLPNAWQAAC